VRRRRKVANRKGIEAIILKKIAIIFIIVISIIVPMFDLTSKLGG